MALYHNEGAHKYTYKYTHVAWNIIDYTAFLSENIQKLFVCRYMMLSCLHFVTQIISRIFHACVFKHTINIEYCYVCVLQPSV